MLIVNVIPQLPNFILRSFISLKRIKETKKTNKHTNKGIRHLTLTQQNETTSYLIDDTRLLQEIASDYGCICHYRCPSVYASIQLTFFFYIYIYLVIYSWSLTLSLSFFQLFFQWYIAFHITSITSSLFLWLLIPIFYLISVHQLVIYGMLILHNCLLTPSYLTHFAFFETWAHFHN